MKILRLARNDLALVSANGDINISGSRLTAGRDIELSAINGAINFGAEITSDYEQTETYSDNGLWWKSRDQGHYREDVVHNAISAGGTIKFRAANGITIEYKDNGSLEDALATFSQSPDLKWMAALQGDNRVQWNAVIAQSQEWDYEAEGLTAPAAALIAIALTAATGGSPLGTLVANAPLNAALNAGMQALINRSAISLINNKGDLGATLKELGSEESLRSLAVAMISAGVTTHLDTTLFKDVVAAGSKGAGFDPNLLGQQLVRDVTYSAVRAGISTSIQGGDFGDQFTSNLRYAAASTIGKQFAEEIGEAYKKARGRDENGRWNDPNAQQYLSHKLAHAVLGCGIGAIANGNCAAGAAGGVAGAVVADGYEALTYDEFKAETDNMIQKAAAANGGELSDADRAYFQNLFKEWQKRGVDLSKLSGALLAAGVGGDANIGALTAGNAAENNILPAVIIIAKIGLAAYTAYELAETGKKAVQLYQDIQAGREFTDEELRAMAIGLGIEIGSDVVLSKLKVLEAAADIVKKAGLDQKADELYAYIKREKSPTVTGGLCSFHGSTQVLTKNGYSAIQDLTVGMFVWSRNDRTGQMAWKSILAQYSNRYEDTVHVSLRDIETGEIQTIISNKIHPFFVQVPQSPTLLNLAATGMATRIPLSSEGHHYQGPIANGHWVDASNLKSGYRLLNDNESWAEVVSVEIERQELKAYNLTVADFHTYFVRGADNDNAEAVWVHNNCFNKVDFNINRLPQERQVAVNDTLSHINSGTVPSGSTRTRWGITFRNRDGDLPAKTSQGVEISYQEYRIAPRPGQTGAGTDRIVVGSDGRQYYTGTHYGDNPGKPFVRIK